MVPYDGPAPARVRRPAGVCVNRDGVAAQSASFGQREPTRMRFIRQLLIISAVTGLTVAGCGGERVSERAKVRGKVTYKGKPMTFGSVLFMPVETPKDGVMEPASGTIGADGTYELTSPEGGAVLGEHKVIVYAVEPATPGAAPKPSAKDDPSAAPAQADVKRLKNLVPTKYAAPDTTPLIRKVVAGNNTIDLEITD